MEIFSKIKQALSSNVNDSSCDTPARVMKKYRKLLTKESARLKKYGTEIPYPYSSERELRTFEDFLSELAQIVKDNPQYASEAIECCAQALAKTDIDISRHMSFSGYMSLKRDLVSIVSASPTSQDEALKVFTSYQSFTSYKSKSRKNFSQALEAIVESSEAPRDNNHADCLQKTAAKPITADASLSQTYISLGQSFRNCELPIDQWADEFKEALLSPKNGRIANEIKLPNDWYYDDPENKYTNTLDRAMGVLDGLLKSHPEHADTLKELVEIAVRSDKNDEHSERNIEMVTRTLVEVNPKYLDDAIAMRKDRDEDAYIGDLKAIANGDSKNDESVFKELNIDLSHYSNPYSADSIRWKYDALGKIFESNKENRDKCVKAFKQLLLSPENRRFEGQTTFDEGTRYEVVDVSVHNTLGRALDVLTDLIESHPECANTLKELVEIAVHSDRTDKSMDMQVRNVTRALVEANPKNLDEAIKIRQYRNKVVSREVNATLEATNTVSQQLQQDSEQKIEERKQKIEERKEMIKERNEKIKELKEKIKERKEKTVQPKEDSSKSHSPEKPKNETKKQVQDNVLNTLLEKEAPGQVE